MKFKYFKPVQCEEQSVLKDCFEIYTSRHKLHEASMEI